MIKKIKQKVCEMILKVLNIKQCFCNDDCACKNPKEKTNA
jgi:hypothetical protein